MIEGLILIGLVIALGAAIELYRRATDKPDTSFVGENVTGEQE